MQQIVLGIKNSRKAQFLLDFLKQLDFIEIIRNIDEGRGTNDMSTEPMTSKSLEEVLLNAPMLSEEEIENIEHVGKEFGNWQIKEF